LSLNLYLDDCAYAKQLAEMLRAAGHTIVIPADVGLTGMSDALHFRYAAQHALVLLTKNPRDFVELHAANPAHAGILVIYQDNDPQRDMTYGEIVKPLPIWKAPGSSSQAPSRS